MALIDLLNKKSNDYSKYEPFIDKSPISSSLIIPHYENHHLLDILLYNLLEQNEIKKNPKLFEIIIIDDGSKIPYKLKSKKYEEQVQLIRFNKNRGRSNSRNEGISKSTHELLFFFDSDIIIPNNYFSDHWKIHNSGIDAIVVGFAEDIEYKSNIKIIKKPNIKKDYRFYKKIEKKFLDFSLGEYRIINNTNWFKDFGYGLNFGIFTLPFMVTTHNISILKSKANLINGFEEKFNGWGLEDTYFGAKAIASGSYIVPINNGVFRFLHEPRGISKKEKYFQMESNYLLYKKLIS
ncbi:hypothetical protein C0585_03515 [Candidatus Woesearchaeota archaeon]|nr:MAG: hypothetical protein C0585_03515 [Candidatus Woesearchaeota archaeon]